MSEKSPQRRGGGLLRKMGSWLFLVNDHSPFFLGPCTQACHDVRVLEVEGAGGPVGEVASPRAVRRPVQIRV